MTSYTIVRNEQGNVSRINGIAFPAFAIMSSSKQKEEFL